MTKRSGVTGKTPGAERHVPKGPATPMSAEERRKMIAEAAYYRAQERGFRGGDPVDDWLTAEAQIDRILPLPGQQKEEQLAYEQLRAEVQKRFAALQGSVDAQAIQEAIERGAAQVKKVGGYAIETINKVAEALKKDMAGTATLMGPRWEAFSDRSANVFSIWRDRGTDFLSRAAVAVGEWLNETGRRLERPQYCAGEMVGIGRFECLRCGGILRLETAGHLAPCPACHHLEFRRAS